MGCRRRREARHLEAVPRVNLKFAILIQSICVRSCSNLRNSLGAYEICRLSLVIRRNAGSPSAMGPLRTSYREAAPWSNCLLLNTKEFLFKDSRPLCQKGVTGGERKTFITTKVVVTEALFLRKTTRARCETRVRQPRFRSACAARPFERARVRALGSILNRSRDVSPTCRCPTPPTRIEDGCPTREFEGRQSHGHAPRLCTTGCVHSHTPNPASIHPRKHNQATPVLVATGSHSSSSDSSESSRPLARCLPAAAPRDRLLVSVWGWVVLMPPASRLIDTIS